MRPLGEGGMGAVYEAMDTEHKAKVALKHLKNKSPEGLQRFKNEFRAFQDLEHPNLVHLGELFEEQGEWFFTMELVDGPNIIDFVRRRDPEIGAAGTDASQSGISPVSCTIPSSSAPVIRVRSTADCILDEQRLRAALRQVIDAVDFLHQSGRLHRDIKSSNILVSPAGRVVLLDFGVATTFGDVFQSAGSLDVVGTVEYMAPEQALGKDIGPEADWYAVGVVLYEALTGRLPFSGHAFRIMQSKQQGPPPSPREFFPAVPTDLEALCMQLLQIDPSQRPDGKKLLLDANPLDAHASTTTSMSAPAPFVGRRDELTQLNDAFDTSRQQRKAVTTLVEGESGVGKSALVRHFRHDLQRRHRDVVVLPGRCFERETVPYKAADGIIDALSLYMMRLPDVEATALLPFWAFHLAETFPVLRRVRALATTTRPSGASPIGPRERRTRLFSAMRELMARLADRHPLVVVVDDLQWADADSLALLSEMLRPPDEPALLFIGTLRHTDPSTRPAPSACSIPAFPGDSRFIALERLPREDAVALVNSLAGGLVLGRRVQMDAEVVAREAEGHPLFIQEFVRYAAACGGTLSGPRARLDDVLSDRAKSLPPNRKLLLELVAVAGKPIEQQVLIDASKMDAHEVHRCISALRTARLLQTIVQGSKRLVCVYHDRLREAVVQGLSADALRVTHHTLARALARGAVTDAESLAMHWLGAGDKDQAWTYTVAAADRAADALAFARAADLYRAALSLAPSRFTATVTVLLANSLANAGRPKEAALAYVQALPLVEKVPPRPMPQVYHNTLATTGKSAEDPLPSVLELRACAAEQYMKGGLVDDGLAIIQTVLAEVSIPYPKTPLRALITLVVFSFLVRVWPFKKKDPAKVSQTLLLRIDACWTVAQALSVTDTLRGLCLNAHAAFLSLRAGDPYRYVLPACHLVPGSALGGPSSRARATALLARLEPMVRQIDLPNVWGWFRGARAMTEYLSGDLNRALELAIETEQSFTEAGSQASFQVNVVRSYRIIASATLGKLAEVSRHTPKYLAESLDRGDLYGANNFRLGLSNWAWLVPDQLAEARRVAQEASAQLPRRGFHLQHWYALLCAVHLDLYAGDIKAAYETLVDCWPAFSRSHLLRIQTVRMSALALRARCALAGARELSVLRKQDLEQIILEAAQKLESQDNPYALPQAHLIYAGLADVQNNMSVAKERLESAIQSFESVHMVHYAAAARYRLGDIIRGDTGQSMRESATAWMTGQGVKNPSAWFAMLAPGFG